MNGNYQYPSKNPILQLKQKMKLRGFSQKIIRSYSYYITKILKFTNKNPKTVNTENIRNYLEKLANEKKSASTLNIIYSTLKLYF